MKNKIITYTLAGILVFLSVFLFLQVRIDKENNSLHSDDFYVEIPSQVQTEEEYLPVENIPHSELLLSDKKYTIYDDKVYNLKDTVEFIAPSKDAVYEKTNSYTEIKEGKMDKYEFQVVNYEFDFDTYMLNFEIEAYAKELDIKTIISSDNFKLSYEGKALENLNVKNYEISNGLTKINISYQFDDSIYIGDINTTFFKFVYSDEFNVKELKVY